MATEAHRQYCRRQHHILAQYLSAEAWRRGLDCIVLVRSELESFLGLKRFKSIRIEWLLEDVKPWFRYQQQYKKSHTPASISSLFLSRVPLKPHLPPGTMPVEARLQGISQEAVRAGLLKAGRLEEATMVSLMVQRATGLAAPPVEVEAIRVRRRMRVVA